MSDFPVIDLAAFEQATEEGKRQMGREVDRICRASGFLAVRNHSIPDEVIANVWSKARDFFDLPYEIKDQARAPYPGYPYGYLGPGAEALARSRGEDSPPDLKESFMYRRPRGRKRLSASLGQHSGAFMYTAFRCDRYYGRRP